MERPSLSSISAHRVLRIQHTSRSREVSARWASDAPHQVRNQTASAIPVEASSRDAQEDPVRMAARLPALIPFLLRGIQNAAPDSAAQRGCPASTSGTDQLLHMPEPLLVSLLGDEHGSPHVVHYVCVDTLQSTFEDHHRLTANTRGHQLYAALDETHRQRLDTAAQELLQQWRTLGSILLQQASSQIPASQPYAATSSQQNSASGAIPADFTAPLSRRLLQDLLNRQGALLSLKPAVLEWLFAHVRALRHMDESNNTASTRTHEEADAAYFAEMDRALSGTLQDALKVPTLARLLHALLDATRMPQR